MCISAGVRPGVGAGEVLEAGHPSGRVRGWRLPPGLEEAGGLALDAPSSRQQLLEERMKLWAGVALGRCWPRHHELGGRCRALGSWQPGSAICVLRVYVMVHSDACHLHELTWGFCWSAGHGGAACGSLGVQRHCGCV